MHTNKKIFERLSAAIDKMPAIDAHDHLSPDSDGTWPQFDLCDLLFHNLNSDLTAGGMPGIGTHAQTPWNPDITDPAIKWKTLSPYMKQIENLASYKGLLLGIKALHDFTYRAIDDHNWAMLNEQVTAAYRRNDWVDYVLNEKCHIKAAIIDMDTVHTDRDYFFPAIKLDYIMMGGLSPTSRKNLEKKHDASIQTFDDFLTLLHRAFDEYLAGGAVAIKSVAAYYRSLFYREVTKPEAQKIFNMPFDNITPEMAKSFQDFVIHQICQLTEKSGLPIQFHTGKLAWNFQNVEQTNPNHLTNLLQKYRQLRFDLFHGGLPYGDEFGILVNNFPNAYLDLNGLSWTSFAVTKRYLSEWLEMTPQNKILWGADSYRVLEGVLGQLLYFKRILAEVLAQKIEDGYFDEDSALELAEKILYKNVCDFFALGDKIKKCI